jgi:hypothetical protein
MRRALLVSERVQTLEAPVRNLLLVLILVVTLSTLANAQSNDRQRSGLTGPVKSIREEKAKLEDRSGQQAEGPRLAVQQITFDEKGNAIEQILNNPDGSLKSKLAWALRYDSEGGEIEKSYYNAEGKLTSKGSSTYTGGERKTQLTHSNSDGSINHHQIYVYDGKGNKIEESHRNPDNSPRAQILYTYDDKGRQTEALYLKPDGTVSQKSVFTYDERVNRTGFTVFDGAGLIKIRYEYKYDSRGNLIQLLNQGDGNEPVVASTYSYEFDHNGNWVKRETEREVIGRETKRTKTEVTYRVITYY